MEILFTKWMGLFFKLYMVIGQFEAPNWGGWSKFRPESLGYEEGHVILPLRDPLARHSYNYHFISHQNIT